MIPYVYVIVRKDIPMEQQVVQVAHATLECGFKFNRPDKVCHIVVLEVANSDELMKASEQLLFKDINYTMFYEPDYDIGYSALATEPSTTKIKLKNIKMYNTHVV